MNKFFRKLHLYLYLTTVFLFFLLSYPLLYIVAKKPKKNYAKIAAIRKWISLPPLFIMGFRVKVTYEATIDWSQNYIICPNHSSILDVSILDKVCKQASSFMGKDSLLKNPVTRTFFKTIDIPVNRSSRVSAYKAYKKAEELLQEHRSLVIFPEGRIDEEFPPVLHPFKKGAFRLAKENNTLILPIVIHNAWELLWDDGLAYGSKPGTIHVTVLRPISPHRADKEEEEDLEKLVYNRMKYSWENHNKS
ncbi:lysophospholipid acyltransferase family protein [Sphingobacterium sp. MYb382]|uniref:lysophospholipid acyltransferase family protein n=1 Tax=Sphingobacterium sp. MYb382 TaxID=2745278 RepID=UPI0030B773C8